MAAGRVALLCLGLFLLVFSEVTSSRICQEPTWPAELGPNPFPQARGKVLLVALVKGYCGYCVAQAQNLEALKAHLQVQGFPDIEILLVNGGEPISRDNIQNFQDNVGLPVLQDTESHVMFQQIFRGNKDDFVVYDRCGQRTFFIPHPFSFLRHSITERVLRATHRGNHNCYCNLDYSSSNSSDSSSGSSGSSGRLGNGAGGRRGGGSSGGRRGDGSSGSRRGGGDPHDQMMGDQPMGGALSYRQAAVDNGINCPAGDRWCQRYMRRFADQTEPRTGSLSGGDEGRDTPLFQGQGRRGSWRRGQGRRRGHRRGGHGGRRRGHHSRSRPFRPYHSRHQQHVHHFGSESVRPDQGFSGGAL